MNKRLLICALLGLGQLMSTSSYASGAEVIPPPSDDGTLKAGHMHRVGASSKIHSDDRLDSPKPSYVHVETSEDLSTGLANASSHAISIQLMRDFKLSDVIEGNSYPAIRDLVVGFFVKLNEGDLTLIATSFPNLKKLCLPTSPFSVDELTTELPKLALQELNITGENITDDVVEALLPLAETLTVLHLNDAVLTARGVENLKRFTNLKYLNVIGTRAIGKDQAAAIKGAIPALKAKGAFDRSLASIAW